MNKLLMVQRSIEYFQQPLTILRQVTGTGVGQWDTDTGKFVRNQVEQVSINGAVINLSHKDLMQLPEAERVEGLVALYTKDAVYTTDEAAQSYSDLLVWQGETFRIIRAYYRELGEFTKAICGKYAYATDDGVPVP